MTPAPPAAAPQTKYTLPTVAFILSLVGLCFCPTALVGCILGIVAWVRIGKEPQLSGKGLAIAATFIPLALVPVIGIQAAIAIPNFIRFQARSKQSECKTTLKALYVAEKSYESEKGKFSDSFEEVGDPVMPGNRYSYFLSESSVKPADAARHPSVAHEDHAAALGRHGIQVGVTEKGFTAACVGNVDSDETLDVWSISSEQRTDEKGLPVAPGVPDNDVNDVTE